MIYLKTENEIKRIRESARLVSLTLAEVGKYIKPGITTGKLDVIAEDFIKSKNALPAFKGYGPSNNPYPNTLCVSVNEEVVHGIPGDRKLMSGDIVSVDCGVVKDGYYGDSAYTFVVESCDEESMKLLVTTMESLYKGIEQAVHGNRVGDIGHAVQKHCESAGFGVVRDLVGHGFGKDLHEDPSVPNYGKIRRGDRLRTGMTLAIEPMITMGTWKVNTLKDGWTVVTADSKRAAHYEHDVLVKEGNAEILSTFDYIEEITNTRIDKMAYNG